MMVATVVIVMVTIICILGGIAWNQISREIKRRKYQRNYLCGLCSIGDGRFVSPSGKLHLVYKLSKSAH